MSVIIFVTIGRQPMVFTSNSHFFGKESNLMGIAIPNPLLKMCTAFLRLKNMPGL